MPNATTAMVFVDKACKDNTLRILLKRPTSTSTNGVHMLIGELRDDTKDPVGIWFKDVPNPQEVALGAGFNSGAVEDRLGRRAPEPAGPAQNWLRPGPQCLHCSEVGRAAAFNDGHAVPVVFNIQTLRPDCR